MKSMPLCCSSISSGNKLAEFRNGFGPHLSFCARADCSLVLWLYDYIVSLVRLW